MQKEFFIKLENVSKVYGSASNPVHALRDINVELFENEYISIMGPSGSGKSTFFNMLGALDRCSSGTVIIGNVDLESLNDMELAFFRGNNIGYIFQSYNLIESLTALKNVALPAMFLGISPEESEKKAKDVLERVGLGHRMHHRPCELSGGQQQRVAIARALVNNPPIVLADEPTANLDFQTGEDIIDLLKELCVEFGTTVITATHDHKMLKSSDRIIWIVDGKIDRIENSKDLNIEEGGIEKN